MKKYLLFTILTLLLVAVPGVYAREGSDDSSGSGSSGSDGGERVEDRSGRDGGDDNRIEIRVEDEREDEVENEVEDRVEIRGNEFEIRGVITQISNNSFTVLGQNIVVDPSQVTEFRQRGILEVGQRVKVKGVIINNTNFAQEIRLDEEGEEEVRVEVRNVPTLAPSVTPTVTPGGSRVEIRARGPVESIRSLLQQIITMLNSLVNR